MFNSEMTEQQFSGPDNRQSISAPGLGRDGLSVLPCQACILTFSKMSINPRGHSSWPLTPLRRCKYND